jgi:endonuclease-3
MTTTKTKSGSQKRAAATATATRPESQKKSTNKAKLVKPGKQAETKKASKSVKAMPGRILADAAKAKPAKLENKPAAKPAAKSTSGSKSGSKAKTSAGSKSGSKAKTSAGSKSTLTSQERKVHEKRVKDTEFAGSTDAFKKVSPQFAQEELDLLCKLYPDADCELEFDTPFQLITAVIMSAQTTDVNVNKVTKNLFAKYPDAKALAEADLDDIKEIIRSTGYYNAKATNIQNCARKLVEKFDGEVPQTLEELTTLPGVGRKTANVVLGVAYGVPGWTVDTHVQRLCKRLGLTNEQDPEKIEYALQKLFPNQDWSKYSITLIWHGRRICFARKPNCEGCPISHLCPSSLAPVR